MNNKLEDPDVKNNNFIFFLEINTTALIKNVSGSIQL